MTSVLYIAEGRYGSVGCKLKPEPSPSCFVAKRWWRSLIGSGIKLLQTPVVIFHLAQLLAFLIIKSDESAHLLAHEGENIPFFPTPTAELDEFPQLSDCKYAVQLSASACLFFSSIQSLSVTDGAAGKRQLSLYIRVWVYSCKKHSNGIHSGSVGGFSLRFCKYERAVGRCGCRSCCYGARDV